MFAVGLLCFCEAVGRCLACLPALGTLQGELTDPAGVKGKAQTDDLPKISQNILKYPK